MPSKNGANGGKSAKGNLRNAGNEAETALIFFAAQQL
jgi:hypothetical protein